MDFRDQSSPLMCRSINNDGQSLATLTNSGKLYQKNSVAGVLSIKKPATNFFLYFI